MLRKEGRRCSKAMLRRGSHGSSQRGAERKQDGAVVGGAGRVWRPERKESEYMQEQREGPNDWPRKEGAEFNICKKCLESHGAGEDRPPERNEFKCMERRATWALSGSEQHGARPSAWPWTRDGRDGRSMEEERRWASRALERHGARGPRSSRGGHSLIGNHRRNGSRR